MRAAVVLGAALAAARAAAAQGGGGFTLADAPASARAAALGGAATALVGDAGAVFVNPADLATVRHLAVEGTFTPYIAGTSISTAALALRFAHVDWGVGAAVLDYGSDAVIVPDPATGGATGMPTGQTFTAADALAATSLVYRRSLIALGVTGKYALQAYGPARADTWAGDAGLTLAIFDIAALGVSVQNIGGDFQNGTRLPQRVRAGFTLNYADPEGTFRFLSTIEGRWPRGAARGPASVALGFEGGIVAGGVGLVGRLGYASFTGPSAGSPLTFGGGIELGRFHLDFAHQGFDLIPGGINRVGLRWTP